MRLLGLRRGRGLLVLRQVLIAHRRGLTNLWRSLIGVLGRLVDGIITGGFRRRRSLDDGRSRLLLRAEREVLFEIGLDVLGRPLERIGQRGANIRAQAPADLLGHALGELRLRQRADEQLAVEPQDIREPRRAGRHAVEIGDDLQLGRRDPARRRDRRRQRPHALGLGGIGKLDPRKLRSERRQPGAPVFQTREQRRLVEALFDEVGQRRQRREWRRLHRLRRQPLKIGGLALHPIVEVAPA